MSKTERIPVRSPVPVELHGLPIRVKGTGRRLPPPSDSIMMIEEVELPAERPRCRLRERRPSRLRRFLRFMRRGRSG